MTDSFWFNPLLGGVIIGLSAAILMAFIGRIAGICSILANAILPSVEERGWRWVFIAGLIIGTLAVHQLSSIPVPAAPKQPAWLVVLSGLLVGYGTQLGSGCTSGHSVCGISRFSLRSFSATLVFMATGFITVFFIRHLLH